MHNILVSQLHRARQFNRLTAARGSRMFAWMSAQGSVCEKVKGLVTLIADDDEPAIPVTVFRPICSESIQLLLCKHVQGGILEIAVGLVFSVWRGAVARTEASNRKLRVSKNLGINAPVDAVARVSVLILQKLPDSTCEYVVSLLSEPRLLVPHTDVICEVPIEKSNESAGKMFFQLNASTCELIKKLSTGEIFYFPVDNSERNQRYQKGQEG